jgi:hypothetical protein
VELVRGELKPGGHCVHCADGLEYARDWEAARDELGASVGVVQRLLASTGIQGVLSAAAERAHLVDAATLAFQ